MKLGEVSLLQLKFLDFFVQIDSNTHSISSLSKSPWYEYKDDDVIVKISSALLM